MGWPWYCFQKETDGLDKRCKIGIFFCELLIAMHVSLIANQVHVLMNPIKNCSQASDVIF